MEHARLIIDDALDGPTNMAVDEALLTLVGRGLAQPALRFYRWSVPTISLGHFQKHQQVAQLPEPFKDLALVRRITGGGAILHHAELTYSLVLPASHHLVKDRPPGALYQAVHQGLIAVLCSLGISAQLRQGPSPRSAQRGPFFCFQRVNPSDLMVDGQKIAGSAQRRTLRSLLQHGSLMLDNPLGQPGVTSLANCKLPKTPDTESLARAWARQLSPTLALNFTSAELTEAEVALAHSLRAKYASDEWTKRR